MPTYDEVMNAAAAADAQGNADDAKHLLTIAKGMQGEQKPAAESKQPSMQSPQMSPQQGAQPSEYSLQQAPSLKESATDIAKGTGIGAAIGAIAPELVTGAGMAMEAVPGLQVPGAALIAGGRLMRASRVASTLIGAGQGALSSTAGQIARQAGASPSEQTGVELATGLGAPAIGKAASTLGYLVGGPIKAIAKAVQTVASGEQATSKAVKMAQENLSARGSATQPQVDFHATLAAGVEADKKAANLAAEDALDAARKHADTVAKTDAAGAQSILREGEVRAAQFRREAANRAEVLDRATNGKLKTATQVQKAADEHLKGVGEPAEMSDIGNAIRKDVTAKQGAAVEARNAQYKELQAQRDAIVAEKEAAGHTIDTMPEMKALKKEIDTFTLDTKAGQKAAGGLAKVTDPQSLADYRRVREALGNRRVQSGTDEAGNPTYSTFKTTFEALDDVRRKLGDALSGPAKEGYSAIGQKRAQELYAKLSEIQDKYIGGGLQKKMQTGYAEATGDLTQFKTGAGKKITATDRLAPDTFVKDPATLPGQFFKTQQGVKDLRELTGDPAKVSQMASAYVAKNLQGKSSDQARNWLKGQSDWLREEPGTAFNADHYVKKLEQSERVADKLNKRASSYQSEKSKTLDAAEKAGTKETEGATARATKAAEGSVDTQQRIVKEGEAKATEIRKGAEDRAKVLRDQNFPAEATRKLLTSGSPEEIRYATRYVAGTPGGKQVLESAVRGVLRDAGPKNIGQLFQERIRPMLKDGNMLPPGRLQKLEADVQRVIDASENGKPKPGAIANLVRAALISGPVATGTNKGNAHDTD